MSQYLLQTYNPLPIHFVRGEGVWLYDAQNKAYLDALCGIGVTGLGHHHPAVTKAIQSQAEKILHLSNLVQIPEQQELAKLLSVAAGFPTRAFFCNSGAEAIEGVIKLSRLYGHSKNIDVPKILVMEGAFHGRTMGAVSACGGKKVQAGFEPLLEGFVRVPYNDINAIQQAAKQDPNIVALLVEPVQGEGGIQVPDPNYLSQIRQICTENKWLMMLDEIQSGMGRTGQIFAFQHANIQPDVIALAKGLANGVPIGAFLVAEPYGELFKVGSHGSTFGGNPLSMAAGLATLNTLMNEQWYKNASKQGEWIFNGLKKALHQHPHVKEVRGKGLMIGIELDRPCRPILNHALKHGILFNITKENTIRLLPPLILGEAEARQIVEIIPVLIEAFMTETA